MLFPCLYKLTQIGRDVDKWWDSIGADILNSHANWVNHPIRVTGQNGVCWLQQRQRCFHSRLLSQDGGMVDSLSTFIDRLYVKVGKQLFRLGLFLWLRNCSLRVVLVLGCLLCLI